MNNRNRVLILFVLFAGLPLAIAQDLRPGVGTDVSVIAPPESDGTVPPPRVREANSNVDVRFCLDFATNMEVIMCADKYRPHRRKAAR